MKRIKLTREDSILLFSIIAFSLIICNAFLKMHYSSDTFCLMYRGYFEYPSYYFLLDARIISTLVCYIGGILHLPYNVYLISLDVIGVIFLSLSVFILYKLIIKQLDIKSVKNKILILIGIYVIIFNHVAIEYLLYPESGVMCLSILLTAIATKVYVTQTRKKYLKTLLLMILGTLCYQGTINLLPVLVSAIIFLKNKREFDIKITLKVYILDMLKIGIMFIISMLISYAITKIADVIIGDTSSRLRTGRSLLNVIEFSKEIITVQFSLIPKYLAIIVMIITSMLLLMYSSKKLQFIHYLLVVIAAYVFTMLPIMAWGYLMARMAMGIGALMGVSLLFIGTLLEEEKPNKIAKEIFTVLIILYFIFNSINFLRNANQHISANKIDENMAATINTMINRYEKETGNTVTKFEYKYDKNTQQYAIGIKPLLSLTERKIMVQWCIVESMYVYCGKYFEKNKIMPDEIYDKYFNGKELDVFSEDNIVFEGNTMYMYAY